MLVVHWWRNDEGTRMRYHLFAAGAEAMLPWLRRVDIDTCCAAVALATAALGWREAAQTPCVAWRGICMIHRC